MKAGRRSGALFLERADNQLTLVQLGNSHRLMTQKRIANEGRVEMELCEITGKPSTSI